MGGVFNLLAEYLREILRKHGAFEIINVPGTVQVSIEAI